MAHSSKYLASEASHTLRRSARYGAGLGARAVLRVMTAVGAAAAGVSGSTGFLYMSGLVGVSTGVGLQAYLNHKDFEHSKQQLATMYRNEMAAYFGKNPREITVNDIERLAKINPSIGEHIDRERTKRNVRTGVWMVAGALGFTAAATIIAATSLPTILAGLAAFATFQISRPLVKNLGEDFYRLNEPTTVELIKGLEAQRTRGQSVNQAQVMSAFVSASPALDKEIKQQFGAKFSRLTTVDKHRAVLQFGEHFMIEEVTQAINENRLNARELTFRIHNDVSGAYPDPSYKDQWNEGVSYAKDKAVALKQNAVEGARNLHQNAVNSVRSFVSREAAAPEPEQLGTAPTFQEREMARRAASANTEILR